MRAEFERALRQVFRDFKVNPNGADLVAVGVSRDDCLSLLEFMLEGEAITPELLAMLVQVSVATGVWLERERWQSNEILDRSPFGV
jgi:hypothetical protein